MAVAVQGPAQPKEKKDPLDTIIKGLSVASQIYGIKEAGDKADLLAEQRKTELANQQFTQAAKEAELAKEGFQKQVGADGKPAFLRPPGFQSLADQYTEAKIAALQRGPKTDPMVEEMRATRLQKMRDDATRGSADQSKVGGFANRVQDAEKIFQTLAEQGYDGTGVGAEVQSKSILGLSVPDRFKSEEFKKLDQAQRNFINAVLRRESGAAISPSEFDSARAQYFPQAGDTPDVLAQKKDNRDTVFAGLQSESGPAFANIQKTRAQNRVAGQKAIETSLKVPGLLPSANASEAAPPAKVIQNGHEYILNPKTGKYE
jgi:DNA-binding phage protein